MAHLSRKLIGKLLADLTTEIEKACRKHPAYPSIHHGVAVIEEELTELKTEVFKQKYDHEKARKEALQIACTAIRYIHDLDRQFGRVEPEKDLLAPGTIHRVADDGWMPLIDFGAQCRAQFNAGVAYERKQQAEKAAAAPKPKPEPAKVILTVFGKSETYLVRPGETLTLDIGV